MRMQNKIAILTGAAGGMGRASAEAFAREGAVVVVTDVLGHDGEATAAAIRAGGGRAEYRHLDVCDEESWIEVVDDVVERHGHLDVLVNNAGISGTYDPDLASTDFYDLLMRVNAQGVFLGIKHGSAAMARTGRGSIVNMSSISASIGQPGVHMGYGASKAAIAAMTRIAAVQHADCGVRVNAVAPGMLPAMRTSRGSADPSWRAQQIAGVPIGGRARSRRSPRPCSSSPATGRPTSPGWRSWSTAASSRPDHRPGPVAGRPYRFPSTGAGHFAIASATSTTTRRVSPRCTAQVVSDSGRSRSGAHRHSGSCRRAVDEPTHTASTRCASAAASACSTNRAKIQIGWTPAVLAAASRLSC